MKFTSLLVTFAVLTAIVLWTGGNYKKEAKMETPHQKNNPDVNSDPNTYEKATFAAGCFWHVQYEFDQAAGVVSTIVGYTGGKTENPTYKQVCTGKTGHAEAVEIIYDPNKVTYGKLLDVFFNMHDPTTLNRQGPDTGLQYRSAVFYHNESQRKAAIAEIEKLSKSSKFSGPIVTEVTPDGPFYKAEDYHQKYVEKHGVNACPAVH